MPLPASAASVCRRAVPAGLIACALLLLSSCANFNQLTDTLGFTGSSAEANADAAKEVSPAPEIITRDNDPLVLESLKPENIQPLCKDRSDLITGCRIVIPSSKDNPEKIFLYNYKNGVLNGLKKVFYQDGSWYSLYMYTQYVNGTIHGLSRLFAPSGELAEEGLYDQGKLVTVKEFFPNGQLKGIDTYNSKEQITSHKGYHENGQLALDQRFLDGKINGPAYAYYANGNLQEEGFYLNNERHGLFTGFYDDGTVKIKCNFINDKEDGECITYYPNGNIKADVNYSEGKRNGLFSGFYEDGTLKIKGNHINDKRDGECTTYYPNGNIEIIINYSEGKRNGLSESFLEDGTLESKSNYINDELDGECSLYYPDGKIKSIVNYSKGKPNGRFVSYYPSGAVDSELYTKDGQLHGPIKAYFDNPKKKELAFTCAAENGKNVGICRTYEEGTGNLTAEAHYVDGKLDGTSYAYDKGKLVTSTEWKNGVLDGTATLYTANGKIYQIIELKDGNFVSGTCPLSSRIMTSADYKNMMNGQAYCGMPISPRVASALNTILRLLDIAARVAVSLH